MHTDNQNSNHTPTKSFFCIPPDCSGMCRSRALVCINLLPTYLWAGCIIYFQWCMFLVKIPLMYAGDTTRHLHIYRNTHSCIYYVQITQHMSKCLFNLLVKLESFKTSICFNQFWVTTGLSQTVSPTRRSWVKFEKPSSPENPWKPLHDSSDAKADPKRGTKWMPGETTKLHHTNLCVKSWVLMFWWHSCEKHGYSMTHVFGRSIFEKYSDSKHRWDGEWFSSKWKKAATLALWTDCWNKRIPETTFGGVRLSKVYTFAKMGVPDVQPSLK